MPRVPLPTPLTSGPFTLEQGQIAGLGAKRLHGNDLQRPFRGVRSASAVENLEAQARAFQLIAPQHTFFCGITAAAIMRVPLPLAFERTHLLHIGVPSGIRALKSQGTVGHKFQIDPDDVREWKGLRITTPERTWCDLATALRVPDLVAAGDYLIHWDAPLASVTSIELALHRHRGRRGRAKLFRAIDLLDDRSESPKESILRVIVVQGGIAGPVANLPIRTSGGFNYRADLAIAARKFILEYQSRFHDESKEFRADMTRISRLEADGWYVMQVNRDDLDNPGELLQRIRTVLSTRPKVL